MSCGICEDVKADFKANNYSNSNKVVYNTNYYFANDGDSCKCRSEVFSTQISLYETEDHGFVHVLALCNEHGTKNMTYENTPRVKSHRNGIYGSLGVRLNYQDYVLLC